VFGIAEPNGVVNDNAGAAATVNGLPNGVHTGVTEPPPPARPKMYNIDLERIHAHLYRGKYLTTQDFLDDLAKIVRNATVFPGDNDRLVKAQMMYTTAQVHTNEFDSHFRLECERMAARERKRREEWAAANPKPAGPTVQAMGIRRSARNNGQEPEVLITDPVQLERRLKRQRSSEPSGESQDETGREGPRSPKKARMTSEAEDDVVDPLDVVGPTSSQPRPATVRFAQDSVEPRAASPSPVTRGQDEMENGMVVVDSPSHPEPSTPTPATMQHETRPRTPSPSPGPRPTLSVPEHHVHTLSEQLANGTDTLTVEQLEQLRAACLGCVWRRRSDWCRDAMVQELIDVVNVFAEEIAEGDLSHPE
jgi:ATPase family AAA domain-containing protein 2